MSPTDAPSVPSARLFPLAEGPLADPLRRTVVRFENVSKTYSESIRFSRNLAIKKMFLGNRRSPEDIDRSEHFALRDVSFTLKEGEALWVTGTHNSGKTTLAKIAAGLSEPDFGRAQVFGVARYVTGRLLRMDGMMTIRENLKFMGAILGVPGKEIPEYMEQVLEFAGFKEFASTLAGDFDKKQLVPLVFTSTLFGKADILVFDERWSVGEPDFRQRYVAAMNERARQKTCIACNLDASPPLDRPFDKAIILHQGGMFWSGLPAEVPAKFKLLSEEIKKEAAEPEETPLRDPDLEDDENIL